MLDKLFSAFLRCADEGMLSRLLVEVSVVFASGRTNGTSALREAAMTYKIDIDGIALKGKQDFAAKEKAKREIKPRPLARSRIAKQPKLNWGAARLPNSLHISRLRAGRHEDLGRLSPLRR
jgi:ParB family chromosome partitioning protein